jgi:hypothetical protein
VGFSLPCAGHSSYYSTALCLVERTHELMLVGSGWGARVAGGGLLTKKRTRLEPLALGISAAVEHTREMSHAKLRGCMKCVIRDKDDLMMR